ncbi:hypothetical protein FHS59_002744 [Algoriphagus iocasae]|uniref:Uncharacterized protein n=1 Tax=Algoriphagus iocasae TaxID=1836499 RepID=A0A841MSK3_9BACT|nr:hypothetical protein [Algoriphagus iocasae]MBB6327116.1 hypothetical protein [Algoriphagus iocasae]
MANYKRFRPIIEDMPHIRCSQLREFGVLKPKNISNVDLTIWIGEIPVGKIWCYCSISEIYCFANLSWINDKKENKTQTVTIQKKESNLISHDPRTGKNSLYFFECPETKKRCRKLYFTPNGFVSREALGALYQDQAQSKLIRQFIKQFKIDELVGKIIQDMKKPYYKNIYKGVITKRAKKDLMRVNKLVEQHKRLTQDSIDFLNEEEIKIRETKKGFKVITRVASGNSGLPDMGELPEWD